jgi:hypothetical protein
LDNLVTLLLNKKPHKAFFFLPIVIWRIANQALSIMREARIHLLEVAFDTV